MINKILIIFGIVKQKCICGSDLTRWGLRLDCLYCFRKYY